ncbi:DNA methyltransferase [Candidatus Aenigmatarchaeota archaeon]
MQITERMEWGPLATWTPNRDYPVYNWFYYKEGFSRQLVMNILDMFGAKERQLVMDPFCGAGTTMLTCRERGIDSVGFDSHPLAVFASRVKLMDYSTEDLIREIKRVTESEFVKPDLQIKNKLLKKGFPKKSLEDIVFYRNLIMQTRNKDIRDFLLLGLMNVAMKCSWLYKDGSVIKVRKGKKSKKGKGRKGSKSSKNIPLPRKVLKNEYKRMLKDIGKIMIHDSRVRADFGDARRLGMADNVVDFIITSPPYVNKREYEKVFQVEQGLFMGTIGFEPYSSYIGSIDSNIKELEKDSAGLLKVMESIGEDTGKIPKTAMAYFMDMYQAIEEMYRVCKPGAKVAVVVGNGCFPTRVIDSDIILTEIAEAVGFKPKKILVLNKRWCTRDRTKKIGIARESLLIWEK